MKAVKLINKFLGWLNQFQQKHRLTAFILAVIKKYGDDQAGREAALTTYYGFLSLFPLLLVLTTITNILVGHNSHLSKTIIGGLTNYFPLLGSQLSAHVNQLHSNGLALISGILITLYGSRGVANVFRTSLQRIWLLPASQQPGFPWLIIKSIVLVIVAGGGFILASVSAGLASAAGHGIIFRGLSVIVNWIILYWLFIFILKFSLPKKIKLDETMVGAAVAATGLVILQLLGGYILARELKHLDALYSYFAVALGLMSWLYLQSQVLYYSIEIAVVKSKTLWPRSLDAARPSTADLKLASM